MLAYWLLVDLLLKKLKTNKHMLISKYQPQAYALLRIMTGFLFLWHGSQKLFSFPPAGMEIPLWTILVAGPIEFFGGLFVMFGFLSRWAAFICSGEMAFAYWIFHGPHAALPLLNHGEMAVLYCFLFLFISAQGSGICSVDHWLEKRRQNHE
jgi:putative oxidoreductase